MAAPTQLGTTLKIGYGTNVYSGYIMEEYETSAEADQDVIKDEDNLTTTVIVSDPKTNIKFSAIIKSTGSLTPPVAGASISINSIKYRVLTSSVSQNRLASKLNISAIKEDSMTYT